MLPQMSETTNILAIKPICSLILNMFMQKGWSDCMDHLKKNQEDMCLIPNT